jgi:hypothetical protein
MSNKKNNGQLLEQVVHLIEKSIDPEADVRHNEWLPVLTSKTGRKIQCDVVIRKGKEPRITTWIVEVQDRNSKVKPNEFRGWLQKMHDVGAQHLVVVSRLDFPIGVVDAAITAGGSVSLIVLRELNAQDIPIDFIKPQMQIADFKFIKVHSFYLVFDSSVPDEKKPKENPIHSKVFSFNKTELISILDVCRHQCAPLFSQGKGRNTVAILEKREFDCYYFDGTSFIDVSFRIEFDWIVDTKPIQYKTISYEQNEHGALAWLLEVDIEFGNIKKNLKIPVVKEGGEYTVTIPPLGPDLHFRLDVIPPK